MASDTTGPSADFGANLQTIRHPVVGCDWSLSLTALEPFFIDWRTGYRKRNGKTVGRNTAIMELKLLAVIMGEAVRLGHADANPLVSLKLRRDKWALPKNPTANVNLMQR
jgi:hypothetical protein